MRMPYSSGILAYRAMDKLRHISAFPGESRHAFRGASNLFYLVLIRHLGICNTVYYIFYKYYLASFKENATTKNTALSMNASANNAMKANCVKPLPYRKQLM